MLATKPLSEVPATDIRLVRDSLASLECPNHGDSVWGAPFDQLTGAGYALLAAERHGYSHRDQRRFQFQPHIRQQIASWIAGYSFPQHVSDHEANDELISGFYFNSAVQRLVWTSERLIALFAALPCPCGRKPETVAEGSKPMFHDFWKGASKRVDHIAFEHRHDLQQFGLVVLQMAPDRHQREIDFNPEMVLSMLRFAVKHRKPTLHVCERRPDNHERLTWSAAAPGLQMKSACEAFALLCLAYNELVQWHPDARQATLVGLGEAA
jgi:hypothetical protein